MAGGAVSTARYIGGVIGISALGYLLGGEGAGVDAHGAATVVYSAPTTSCAGAHGWRISVCATTCLTWMRWTRR